MTAASERLLVLLGPTASGKTKLAVAAARALHGEILSADSRQVYRGLDLGSGKDLADYGEVPYHLIDLVAPTVEFSLFDFIRAFCTAFSAVAARGHLPILAGGSGLYLDAVVRGYTLTAAPPDPALRQQLADLSLDALRARLLELRPQQHNRTDLESRERLLRALEIAMAERDGTGETLRLPPLRPRVYGLTWPRDELRRRIARRLKERLAAGLLDEVAGLHAAGVSWATLDFFGLEYRFVARHLRGELTHNDLFQQLNSAIGQFAKRQETWFRRMQRQGVAIHWLDGRVDPLAELLADWRRHAP
ncbi:MAG: tRNA (adenosine(37)-N6)-dimethylallyltransferase MiaA [Desulfuromonadales bacterium]|nr:tRNA (adenosine(37)-N6)-dimethylallyltransferase MiaA [Desulfuromonadales bacterium]